MKNDRKYILYIKRKIVRLLNLIKYVYLEIDFQLNKKKIKKYNFFDTDSLFNEIICNKKSLARFGDGEIRWISTSNKDSFQENNIELSKKLIKSITAKNENLIIAIPNVFYDLKKYKLSSKAFWRIHLKNYRSIWEKYLNNEMIYGDSLITRSYFIYKKNNKKIFDKWKEVWENRKVIIIEGDKTLFGIGNDLLKNAKSVKRIIAPSENAFNVYNKILNYIYQMPKEENYLFLVSLGPTASILSVDLSSKGYQCIDIGHLDLEYEWMLRSAKRKITIPGKYNNEGLVKYINHIFTEEEQTKYNNSIIKVFTN